MSNSDTSPAPDRSRWFWVAILALFFFMQIALLMSRASFLFVPIITYLAGFYLAKKSFPIPMSLFLAACFMVFVHVAVPLPSQIVAHYRMERFVLDPVGATFVSTSKGRIRMTPIEVSGDVAVEWHDSTVPNSPPFQRDTGCDQLCKTLLYRDGVTSVTMSNIAPLSSVELRGGEPGRAISSATFRRKAAAECVSIATPSRIGPENRPDWELLRDRCFESAGAVSRHDFVIRHGWWSLNQPVIGLKHPIDLRLAAEKGEFVVEFQEVRRNSGTVIYRRFCTEMNPVAPVLFVRQTNYLGEGVGFELERQRLTSMWPCGHIQYDF